MATNKTVPTNKLGMTDPPNFTDISDQSNQSIILDQPYLLDQINWQMSQLILPITIINGIESVVGIIGNILILVIYSRQYSNSNFRYFVIFMAVTDLTSCSTCIPIEVYFQMNWYRLQHVWLCKAKAYFNVATSWNSAALLILFSFDRCRKICLPLKPQIQPKLALKLCVGTTIASVLICTPCMLGWGKMTYDLPTDLGNVTVSICGRSFFLPDEIYKPLFNFYVYAIIVFIFLITIINIVTVQQLVRGQRLIPTTFNNRRPSFSSKTKSCSIHTLSDNIQSCAESESSTSNEKDSHDSKHRGYIDASEVSFELHNNDKGRGNYCIAHAKKYNMRKAEKRFATVGQEHVAKQSHERKDDCENKMKDGRLYKFGSDSDMSVTNISKSDSVTAVSNSGIHSNRDTRGRTKKLVIMFTLTLVFVVTMTIYMLVATTLTSRLTNMEFSDSEMAVYFFAWRIYYINYMLNPFLYGFMDPRFRQRLMSMCRKK